MNSRVAVAGFVGCLILALSGCGPKYVIIRNSRPSALIGVGTYTVQADFASLVMPSGTEAAHMAGKDPAWQQAWQNDKLIMHAEFMHRLQNEGTGAAFSAGEIGTAQGHIDVRYSYIDPGLIAPFVNRPTQVTARMIFSFGGQVSDEIEITWRHGGGGWGSSVTGRMKGCGGRIGAHTGRYIRDMTRPGPGA